MLATTSIAVCRCNLFGLFQEGLFGEGIILGDIDYVCKT